MISYGWDTLSSPLRSSEVFMLQAEQVPVLDPADGVHRGGDGGEEAGRLRQVREGLWPLPLQTQQILVSRDS